MKYLLAVAPCLILITGCSRKPGMSPSGSTLSAKQELVGSWKTGGISVSFGADGACKLVAQSNKAPLSVPCTYKWVDDGHIRLNYRRGKHNASDVASIRFEQAKLYMQGSKEPKPMVLERAKK